MGLSGISAACLDAIVKLLNYGDEINNAKLLTCSKSHCFILTVDIHDLVAVKSGFSSGYNGEGPRALATALLIFQRHGIDVEEYEVSSDIIEKIDRSCLMANDIDKINNSSPISYEPWYKYSDALEFTFRNNTDWLNRLFPQTIPLGIIDSRLTDLALKFQEDPDNALLSGYRRLEDIIRARTGLNREHSKKLFAKAFHGENSLLTWDDIDQGEQAGRAQLFTGTYMAFRNRRAHRELNHSIREALQEFLLINQLYLLEKQSIMRVEE